jgi:hypothetical protein
MPVEKSPHKRLQILYQQTRGNGVEIVGGIELPVGVIGMDHGAADSARPANAVKFQKKGSVGVHNIKAPKEDPPNLGSGAGIPHIGQTVLRGRQQGVTLEADDTPVRLPISRILRRHDGNLVTQLAQDSGESFHGQ